MRHRDQFDIEWADLETAAERHDRDWNFRRARLARALGRQQRGGERRGIDRNLQLWPQIEDRAVMVFMRMGEHQADEIFALLHQIADVGKNQIDARQMLFRGKRHAEIDRKPDAAALVAQAVDRQVHTDLADAAERREHQFLLRMRHNQRDPSSNTSPAVTVASPLGCSRSTGSYRSRRRRRAARTPVPASYAA